MTDSVPEAELPEVPDPVEEIPEPPADEPESPTLEARVGTLEGTVSDLVGRLGDMVNPEVNEPDMPGHGQPVMDDKPSKQPWTHRSMFGKR
jgi:hypothetical protein